MRARLSTSATLTLGGPSTAVIVLDAATLVGEREQLKAELEQVQHEARLKRIDAELKVTDDQGAVIVTGTATAALPSRG